MGIEESSSEVKNTTKCSGRLCLKNNVRERTNTVDYSSPKHLWQMTLFLSRVSFPLHTLSVCPLIYNKISYKKIWYFSSIWLFITYSKLIYHLTVFKLIPGISQEKVIFLTIFSVWPSFSPAWFKGTVSVLLLCSPCLKHPLPQANHPDLDDYTHSSAGDHRSFAKSTCSLSYH